jgi:hypothetical protein
MDFLIPAIIGVIIGGLAAYFFFGKDAAAPPQKPPVNDSVGRALVESAHYAAFGPVGMPKEAQDDAFNKLWVWADKSESGMPRG